MLNQAQIIGHLGRDPEVRYLPNGDAVCNFSVATTERWKDKQTGEMKEATEWHRVNAFQRLAEICGQWLRKGSLVYVAGKLVTRKWTDKDGVERYTTEIKASEMKMLGGKQAEQPAEEGAETHPTARNAPAPAPRTAPPRQPATAGAGTAFDDMDDDIPF